MNMKAKLIKDYSFWEKGHIFKYEIKFGIYHLSLRQKDGFYYMMFTMDKEKFEEYFMDIQKERKLKIETINHKNNIYGYGE